ncbi:hypothetical protein MYX76_05070 [Desulfobacterota bacterium AH_259_B03_O07]|nr:hypothetical protein [Desulfobacterota bacterium AH_259_B03_O07]
MRRNVLVFVFIGFILAVLFIAYLGRNSFSDSEQRYFCYPQEDTILPDGSFYSCLICVDKVTGKVDESCNKFEK